MGPAFYNVLANDAKYGYRLEPSFALYSVDLNNASSMHACSLATKYLKNVSWLEFGGRHLLLGNGGLFVHSHGQQLSAGVTGLEHDVLRHAPVVYHPRRAV